MGLPNAIPVVGRWGSNGTTAIGVYSNGSWYLDNLGNGQWDPTRGTEKEESVK